MSDRSSNLKPWPKGVSGNPGGRPKTKPVTAELERLLQEEAPDANGKTWAAVLAQSLLDEARKGNVKAVAEVIDRVEGKAFQAVGVNVDQLDGIAEELQKARKRVEISPEEIRAKIEQLEKELVEKTNAERVG